MNTSKSYEDLSRRALIKLSQDFDMDNDDALLRYLDKKLEENPNTYESIRIPERVIVVADKTATEVKRIGEDVIDKGGTYGKRIADHCRKQTLLLPLLEVRFSNSYLPISRWLDFKPSR